MAIRGRRRQISAKELALAPEPNQAELVSFNRVVYMPTPPLRDKLSERYEFPPSQKGAEVYVRGGVRRAFKNQVPNLELPNPEEELRDRRERARQHIIDNTQLVTWLNTSIADLRYGYLDQTIEAVDAKILPDHDAAIYSADAVEDIGHCLRTDLGQGFVKYIDANEHFAEGIINLGLAMVGEPELILRHEILLDAVRHEQQKRAAFWGPRLGAMVGAFGDRLSDDEHAVEQDLAALLDRRQALEQGTL